MLSWLPPLSLLWHIVKTLLLLISLWSGLDFWRALGNCKEQNTHVAYRTSLCKWIPLTQNITTSYFLQLATGQNLRELQHPQNLYKFTIEKTRLMQMPGFNGGLLFAKTSGSSPWHAAIVFQPLLNPCYATYFDQRILNRSEVHYPNVFFFVP